MLLRIWASIYKSTTKLFLCGCKMHLITWVWPFGNCFPHVRAATNGRVRQPRAPAPSIPRAELPNRASNPPASRIADLFTDRYVCGNEKNRWIGHANNRANMPFLTNIPKNTQSKSYRLLLPIFCSLVYQINFWWLCLVNRVGLVEFCAHHITLHHSI